MQKPSKISAFIVLGLIALCIMAGPMKAQTRTAPQQGLTTNGVLEYQPQIVNGGRCMVIRRQPGSNDTYFAGAESGGLWRTDNGGNTWFPVNGFPHHHITDMEFIGESTLIVTAAIDFLRETAPCIWRSTDRGATWEQPSTAVPTGSFCPTSPGANAITYHRASGTILVATDCGVARSTDGGATWGHNPIDALNSTNADSMQHKVSAVEFGQQGRAYLVSRRGLRYSLDGGITWQFPDNVPLNEFGGPNFLERTAHSIAVSPINDQQAFAVVTGNLGLQTIDGGRNWEYMPLSRSLNRPGFFRVSEVKTGPSLFGVSSRKFALFYGNGTRLRRQEYTTATNGIAQPGGWANIALGHADPTDVCFGTNGWDVEFIAGDGGICRRVGENQALFPMMNQGYDALQFTQVRGQVVRGKDPHLDLYLPTQDNSVWNSSDAGRTWPRKICCEGFHFDLEREIEEHTPQDWVTGTTCGACKQVKSRGHFGAPSNFPGPTTQGGRTVNWRMAPTRILDGVYANWTRSGDPSSGSTTFNYWLTTDFGATWTHRYQRNTTFAGPSKIVGKGHGPIVYQPYLTGASVGNIRQVSILRMLGLTFGGLELFNTANNVNLGYMPLNFNWDPVFGANYRGDVLIAPDVTSGMMRISRDSGRTWADDSLLTTLVTDTGRFVFTRGVSNGRRFPLVSKIAWDDEAPCQVLIGTRQNGIFRSRDNARSWEKLPGTEVIPEITDFFFLPDEDAVLVSSYGRGLWKVLLGDRPKVCGDPPNIIANLPTNGATIVWTDNRPERDINSFELDMVCEGCTWLITRWGQISGLQLDRKNQIIEAWLSSGMAEFRGQRKEWVKPSFDVSWNPNTPFGQKGFMAKIYDRGIPIRALIIKEKQLIGVVLSQFELGWWKAPMPQLTSLTTYANKNPKTPNSLTLLGTGFNPNQMGSGLTTISIPELGFTTEVNVDTRGGFKVILPGIVPPGDYLVGASRKTKYGLVSAAAELRVVVGEEQLEEK